MKILSITAQKPHSTGSGTYLSELVRAFDRQGFSQCVVAGVYPDDTVDFPEGVGFRPVVFHNNSSPFSDISYPIVGMSDIMPYDSTKYMDMTPEMIEEFESAFISEIATAVSELDPDIIICHHLFLLTALVRKAFPDRCIYGICHGTDLRQMNNCDNLRDIVRPEICGLDRIFALHDEQASAISKIFGISKAKITVIGTGYNSELFNVEGRIERKAADPVRICYAGKMSRPKGVPEMLTVLNRIIEDPEMPEISVTLAGGCRDPYVQDMLNSLSEGFTYLGQIPQSELANVLKHNDIFVLPSYFEGLNLAVIEAMACGLIPVCTDLPGMKDWIDSVVPNSNIVYIPMPEMKGIDEPTETGRISFTNDLEEKLRHTIRLIDGKSTASLPDTGKITWDSVAGRIAKI